MVLWALKRFSLDINLGYRIIVFITHTAVTKLFKGRNLTGRPAHWYLTIQEFNPSFKYLPGPANVMTDSLFRNVGVVTNHL